MKRNESDRKVIFSELTNRQLDCVTGGGPENESTPPPVPSNDDYRYCETCKKPTPHRSRKNGSGYTCDICGN